MYMCGTPLAESFPLSQRYTLRTESLFAHARQRNSLAPLPCWCRSADERHDWGNDCKTSCPYHRLIPRAGENHRLFKLSFPSRCRAEFEGPSRSVVIHRRRHQSA